MVFLSDNGGFLGWSEGERVTYNDPLRDGKASLYEGGLRIPMIVRWPSRVEAGSRTNQATIAHLDLYATQLELAGVPVNRRRLDGVSLTDTLLEGKPLASRELYWHWPHYRRSFGGLHASPSSVVRSGDWKLIHFYETGASELYNLADDPGERVDLSRKKPAIAGKLAIDLANWRCRVGAQLPVPNLAN